MENKFSGRGLYAAVHFIQFTNKISIELLLLINSAPPTHAHHTHLHTRMHNSCVFMFFDQFLINNRRQQQQQNQQHYLPAGQDFQCVRVCVCVSLCVFLPACNCCCGLLIIHVIKFGQQFRVFWPNAKCVVYRVVFCACFY